MAAMAAMAATAGHVDTLVLAGDGPQPQLSKSFLTTSIGKYLPSLGGWGFWTTRTVACDLHRPLTATPHGQWPQGRACPQCVGALAWKTLDEEAEAEGQRLVDSSSTTNNNNNSNNNNSGRGSTTTAATTTRTVASARYGVVRPFSQTEYPGLVDATAPRAFYSACCSWTAAHARVLEGWLMKSSGSTSTSASGSTSTSTSDDAVTPHVVVVAEPPIVDVDAQADNNANNVNLIAKRVTGSLTRSDRAWCTQMRADLLGQLVSGRQSFTRAALDVLLDAHGRSSSLASSSSSSYSSPSLSSSSSSSPALSCFFCERTCDVVAAVGGVDDSSSSNSSSCSSRGNDSSSTANTGGTGVAFDCCGARCCADCLGSLASASVASRHFQPHAAAVTCPAGCDFALPMHRWVAALPADMRRAADVYAAALLQVTPGATALAAGAEGASAAAAAGAEAAQWVGAAASLPQLRSYLEHTHGRSAAELRALAGAILHTRRDGCCDDNDSDTTFPLPPWRLESELHALQHALRESVGAAADTERLTGLVVALLAQHPLVAVRHNEEGGGWSSTKEQSGVAVAEMVVCFACKGRGLAGLHSSVEHEEGCPCVVVGAAKRQKQQRPLTDETPAGCSGSSCCCPACAVPPPLKRQGSAVLCVCGKYWEAPTAGTNSAASSTSTSTSCPQWGQQSTWALAGKLVFY
jgi:hypothetical protein